VTFLTGPVKGESYPQYVLGDLFSRYAVVWLLACYESARLAKPPFHDASKRHEITPGS
jgi:hypothetical protein